MSGTSLRDFVSRAVEHKRIRFGDLRRLQRDIPSGADYDTGAGRGVDRAR